MTFAAHLTAPAAVLAVTEAPGGTTQIGVGAIVLMVAIAAFLVWVAYLITSSRRKHKPEETPKNLQPWLSDDELETRRLTRVLRWAAISAAALAVLLPVYFVNESHRQANAAENFADQDVEEGARWFVKFECFRCHGPDGGGGSAEFIEPRSGLTVRWTAPSINDVFFRYSEDEVRYWIEFGRKGTPMPPAGLRGGGAMSVQEVDQVLAYLHSIQLSQSEAFAKADGAVTQALARIRTGAQTVDRSIFEQQAVIADINDTPARFDAIDDFPDRVVELLAGDGTCTDESAALVGMTCGRAGLDSDRDGLTDEAELTLTDELAPVIDSEIKIRRVVEAEDGTLDVEFIQSPEPSYQGLYGLELDPRDPFSMEDANGDPAADLDTVATFIEALDSAHLNLRVGTERQDRFLETAEQGLEALQRSAVQQAWEVDFEATASDMTALWLDSGDEAATTITVDEAQRAVGLFNAYCARCHTGGYSAGVEFEQRPGSGAWAPALAGGRAVVQFPALEDHITFITRGSNLAENYGVNGLGRGWMPGWGEVLSEADLRLIALYERSL